jgi:uncharacterized protein
MKNYVLISGATSGIGLELSLLFAMDNYNLVLIGRSTKKLQELKDDYEKNYKINVEIITTDLSDVNSAEYIYKITKDKSIEVEILVNNAGFGTFGLFSDIQKQTDLNMVNVNVNTLTYLIKLYLPGMIKNRNGKIHNVASTAAFQPGPFMAVYYATKAYVLSLSEALSSELKGTGVTVTALCPGPTATGFKQRAKMDKSNLFKGKIMDARLVAKIGYVGLFKGKTIVIPGFKNKLLAFSVRFTPRKLIVYIVKFIQKES